MPEKPKSISSEHEEALALRIAEQSDLSVNQAKELIRRHGNDWKKIEETAKTHKAES